MAPSSTTSPGTIKYGHSGCLTLYAASMWNGVRDDDEEEEDSGIYCTRPHF